MDNISKAITLAGSVFIAIMIISICMYFYREYADFYDKQIKALEANETLKFNSNFTNFVSAISGDKLNGFDVYNLMGRVIDIDLDEDSDRKVALTFNCGDATYNISESEDVDLIREKRLYYFYFTENLYNYPHGYGNFSFKFLEDEFGYINHIVIKKV